jgi:hypothetical protein
MFDKLNKKNIKSIEVCCCQSGLCRLNYRVNVIHSKTDCCDDSMKPSLKCDNSSSFFGSIPVLVPVVAIIFVVLLIILVVLLIWNFFNKDPAQDDPKPNPIKTRKSRSIDSHLNT